MESIPWNSIWAFFSGLGGLAGVVVAFFALAQLKDVRKSIDDAKRWNKINSAFNYLPKSHEFIEIESQLNDSFIRLIDRNTPLSESDIDKLFTDEHKKLRMQLKTYINMLESFCTAINIGAVDNEAAKSIYSYKFTRHFIEMKPYIERVRGTQHEQGLYENFESIVSAWGEREKVQQKY